VEKTVHAFEAGNGRPDRELAEKSLVKNIGQPSLIALALTIERQQKAWYDQLENT
jgi:Fic family protein